MAQSLDAALEQAVVHHKAGRLPEAERLYRSILEAQPQHSDAHYNLGVLAAQRGTADLGLEHLRLALETNPREGRNWLTYATVLLGLGEAPQAHAVMEKAKSRGLSGPAFDQLMTQVEDAMRIKMPGPDVAALYAAAATAHQGGRIAEAIELYGRLLALQPDHFEALMNLGNAHAARNEAEAAAVAYERALAVRPHCAELHNNLGNMFISRKKHNEAIACFRRALEIEPVYADAHYNLGLALTAEEKCDEAVAAYERAIAIKPDFSRAHFNLGSVLCLMHRIGDGFAAFTQSARLKYANPANIPAADEAPHKLRHDIEQRDYLAGGKAADDAPAVANMFHLDGGTRLEGPAVNPDNKADIAGQWRKNRPQIVVIDDLLTPQALSNLRRFCLGSTVWRTVYDDGYLGAIPDYGFACPLLAQIAEELRTAYPAIFGDHALRYLWGFKYDSTLSGINIHADNAAVNVNFWITPDEANLDPESGGLVVWDVDAPPDWEPAKYNGDIAANREFLARAGAKRVVIPYRANRAVIFDSDLFHETDKIVFKEGYLNRRINVTLLYGPRIAGAK